MELKDFISSNYNNKDRLAQMYIENQEYGTRTYYAMAENIATCYTSEENVYMSMNPITYKNRSINRDKAHLSRLKWLYVDLDYYKSNYNNMQKEELISLFKEKYFENQVPYPTAIIDSGRGIYLLWKIDEHIKAMPKWIKMQKYLYDQFKEYGADPQVVTDSVRVLRQIGSINSKTNTVVSIMEQTSNKYSLTSLLREFSPADNEITDKMLSYAKWIANILNLQVSGDNKEEIRKFIRDNKEAANLIVQLKKVKERQQRKKAKIYFYANEFTMYKARLYDLEILLLKHRDYKGGYREYILFLYRYWSLCIMDSKEDALNATINLNNRLKNPINQKELICATKSAEKYYDEGKIYKRTNKHIIDKLCITKEEQIDMKFFVSKEIRIENKKRNNRKAYLGHLKEIGKQTKAEQKEERKNAIYELLKEGKTQKEICNILKISRSTFYSEKRELKDASYCDTQKKDNAKEKVHVDVKQKHKNSSRKNSPKNSAIGIIRAFRPSPELEVFEYKCVPEEYPGPSG